MLYFLSPQKELITNDGICADISIEEIIEKLSSFTLIALDTETTGLSPFKDKVVLIQFGTEEDQFVIDTRTYTPSLFKTILEDPAKTFIIHNAKFDYNMLKQYNIIISNVYCTQLAEIVINNGKFTDDYIKKTHPFSLKSAYKRYFNIEIDKEIQTSFIEHVGQYTPQQIQYAAKDVICVRAIYEKQLKVISDLKLEKCVELENKFVLVLGDMEYNGIRMDVPRWLELAKNNRIKLEKALDELDKELFSQDEKLISKYRVTSWQRDLFDQDWEPRKCKINWDSSKQVMEILNNTFKIFPVDKRKKPSTGEPALLMLAKPPTIVKKLLEYRELSKAISTYGENFIEKHLGEDGKIHTSFNQIVETGRLSSRTPNMQNIIHTNEYRNCFIADEGYSIAIGDFNSQEPRCTADKCGDEKLIDFFTNGHGDFHTMVTSQMCSIMFNEKVDIPPKIEDDPEALAKHYAHPYSKYRPIGKQSNLKLDYGGTAYTFKFILGVSEEEAQKFIDAYWNAFPKKKAYFNRCAKFALENGYIRTNEITNRIRYFKEFKPYSELLKQKSKGTLSREERNSLMRLKGDIERQAGNSRIQGTCADMVKRALIHARERFMPYGDNIKILLQVHDEIVIMAKDNIIEESANKLKEIMIEAGNIYCKRVPMKVQPLIDKCWRK